MRRRLELLLRRALLPAIGAALLCGAPAAGAATAEGPQLDARSWVLIDADSGDRLAARAASERLPIASATKLMTARLTLAELPLDRKLRVPPYQAAPAESVAGFAPGERVSVRDLLVALLLPSANDAAVALADGVAGSTDAFVRRMNREARRLSLTDTSYTNPVGLDDPDNFSSANDLARLTRRLRGDKRFRRIVAKPEATLRSGPTTRRVTSRNTLLRSHSWVDGVKTGHTHAAGYVLVASAERKGVSLISIVLGARSEAARDGESAKLLSYGFSRYRQRRPVSAGERLAAVPVSHEAAPLALLARHGVKVTARPDQEVKTAVVAPDEVEGPIEAGERIGRALVTVDGQRAAAVAAVAAEAVPAPGPLERLEVPLATALVVGGSMLLLIVVLAGLRQRRSGAGGLRTAEERQESRRQRARQREGKRT
jgi:D-alanyl-D-alanine carboxypeptidase (penicillin-binding protein 5/6)